MEKILDKIRKLLALANSDNEHEAAAAMARAQALMIEYAVSEDQLQKAGQAKDEPIEMETMGVYGDLIYRKKKIPHWEARLAHVLAKTFFCQSYYTPGHDIYMVGRKSDREVFKAAFIYLRGEILRLSDKAWDKQPNFVKEVTHGRSWKRGYHEGAVHTVKSRLEQDIAKLSADNKGTAMVLANRSLAVQSYIEKNVRIRTNNQRTHINYSGYSEGKAAGHGLNLGGRAAKALGN